MAFRGPKGEFKMTEEREKDRTTATCYYYIIRWCPSWDSTWVCQKCFAAMVCMFLLEPVNLCMHYILSLFIVSRLYIRYKSLYVEPKTSNVFTTSEALELASLSTEWIPPKNLSLCSQELGFVVKQRIKKAKERERD
jgi:hypothetical protein